MQADEGVPAHGARGRGRRPSLPGTAAVALVCGLVLGLLNSLSNVFGSPYSPGSLAPGEGVFALEVLAAVLGTPGAWAVTAFLAGWLAHRIWAGPVAGVAALLIADLAYYLSDSLSGYAALSWDELLFWAALAVPTGLVMGLLGALAAQPVRWSILPGLAGPAVLVALARPSGSDHLQPWPVQATLATAVVLGVVVVATWLGRLRRGPSPQPAAGHRESRTRV